ncbi:MAG: AraC family transcriptional regulator [Cellvibrionaceae bacterium]
MKTNSRENYRRRLVNVIDYMHSHLDSDLDVNTLADVALMSPYHFHRIYRELVQETVNGTVRRLRLQQAAADLIRSDQSLSSIAKKASYGSLEAFARAFVQSFGMSPSEYRKSKWAGDRLELEPFIAMLPNERKQVEAMFTVEIIDNEKVLLAGYSHQGDYMEIGKQFEKVFVYGATKQLLTEQTRSIGLYYDDPKSVDVEQLRSMACISIEGKEGVGDELEIITIPEGKCATVLFKGPYAELEKPYDYLFGHWLPESGYEAADFPPFEEYLNDPKETPPNELLTRIHCLLV